MFVCVILGTALLGVAIFSYQLGLDNDHHWGIQRILVAVVGLILFADAVFFQVYPSIAEKAETLFEKYFKSSHLIPESVERPVRLWSIIGCLATILLAVISVVGEGQPLSTPHTRYFDQLADALLQGSFALLEEPPIELLALENPYDWKLREGLEYIWDASLYNGQYYLYFGPVPALAGLLIKILLGDIVVTDQALFMFFFTGFVITFAALIYWLQRMFFSQTPDWTSAMFIFLGGLCLPVLWLVRARYVYETSIIAGQFFLVLGLYAVLRGIESNNGAGAWLMVGGAAWGAAIGARMNLSPGIGLMMLVVIIFLILHGEKGLGRLPALIFPFILWGFWLGYYNFARFGNPLEFGHKFQLTGPAYSDDIREIFSLAYVPPNLFSMFIRPPVITPGVYPYISAPFIRQDMWPWIIRPPDHYYYSEPIVGLLLGIPVLGLLLFVSILYTQVNLARWLHSDNPEWANRKSEVFFFPILILSAGLTGNIAIIALYVASTMRYLADIAPMAIILLAICVWMEFDRLRNVPFLKKIWLILVFILTLLSVLMSLWLNRLSFY